MISSYIGHSEGTTQAFAGLALNATIADLLYGFVGLGPVVSVTHLTNLWLKDLADLGAIWIWNLFGINQFLPTPVLLHQQFIWACAECEMCCSGVIELICGRHIGTFLFSPEFPRFPRQPLIFSMQNRSFQ